VVASCTSVPTARSTCSAGGDGAVGDVVAVGSDALRGAGGGFGTCAGGTIRFGGMGTVTLPSSTGDSTVSLDAVPILDDNIFEADEVFHMKLLKTSSVYDIDKNVGR
jgi:hypothetical protein